MRRLALAALLAAPLLAAGAAAPAFAQDALTPAQRDAVDARIRDYLLANPELVMEALQTLETRQREAAALADADLIEANAEALFEDGFSRSFGAEDADVTIVEFADYRCGYCKAAHPQIADLVEQDGGLRVILKEFPILGPESVAAARAAIAADRIAPDLYWPFHDAMMTHRGQLDEAAVFGIAESVGLDPAALRAEMAAAESEISARLRATYDLARALEIEGTPSFVVGGRVLRGLPSPDQMRAIVAETRENAG